MDTYKRCINFDIYFSKSRPSCQILESHLDFQGWGFCFIFKNQRRGKCLCSTFVFRECTQPCIKVVMHEKAASKLLEGTHMTSFDTLDD